MKKFPYAYFLILSLLFYCCTPKENKLGDFELLPEPQEIEISGVSSLSYDEILDYGANNEIPLPILDKEVIQVEKNQGDKEPRLVYNIDGTLDVRPEGYTLAITDKQITIAGKDESGLFYGFQTLEQILTDARDQKVNLPQCQIKDYPLLAYRAVHLDVKHHLEKTDYYYRLMDKLASYKVNGVILEIEDKLKYERQPIVGSSDALSIEEWKKLSTYAHERHIAISPLVQGLGHASFILKHPEYQDLRDDPKSDWAFNPLDPKTYKVQFDLYLDAMEAFPYGKYLHVGGDEVHTTGRGSGRPALELQLGWLDKVAEFAEDHGKTPIFWDDMPLKQAGVYKPMFDTKMTKEEVDSIWKENEPNLLQFLDKFPKNCIYMRWNYRSPETWGNKKAMQWFADHGMQVMGATAGQTRWALMPQDDSNMESIRSFAVSSIQSGLNGLLLTLWDDDSPHFELYTRGILAFAEYSWSGDKRSKEEIKAAYRQREYGFPMAGKENAFITKLERPVAFWKNALLKGNQRNNLPQMKDPLKEAVIDFPDPRNKGAWSKANAERLQNAALMVAKTDSIALKITEAKDKALRNNYNLEIYEQVNKLAQFSPKLLLALRGYDTSRNREELVAAANKLKDFEKGFVSLRNELERVYGKTRLLTKPDDYILDQDHHAHLANQSKNFDWQFYAEMLFFKKLDEEFGKTIYMENSDPLKK